MDSPQLHLFSPKPYEVERPATHSELAGATVDPAQQRRYAARDQNRERIAGLSPGTQARYAGYFQKEPTAGEDTPMADYGIPVRYAARRRSQLSPFDDPTWRRHSQYAEMPVVNTPWRARHGGLAVGQRSVNAARVTELANHPETGNDPRFPQPERPLVADVHLGGGVYAPVVHNGTHRVAAAVERGEMFTPVDYIDRHHLQDAVADANLRRYVFEGPREMRQDLSYSRMRAGDATEGAGSAIGGVNWGRINGPGERDREYTWIPPRSR